MKTRLLRLLPMTLLLTICSMPPVSAAQMAASAPPAITQASRTPSAILQPALNTLQQTLDTLQPARWKTSATIREEADANISSIRRDLDSTLPPLLATADRAPDSVAQVLPVFRNTEALYDVLLRVAEAARLSAPTQQIAALEQARASLEESRRSLGDHLQSAALARDQQVHALQATIRATPPALPPPPPVCPTPHPAVRRRTTHKKPAAKPAPKPAQPTTQNGTTPSP